MTTLDLTTYAPALLAGACAVLCLILGLRMRSVRLTLEHTLTKARRDAAFVEWAKWTFVSISDADGSLYYRSLHDMQDDPPDLIWMFPRAVILFHAGPDDPEPYKEITHA